LVELKTPQKYLLLLSLFSFGIKAQLLVSPNNNATTLVNQIVGNNVTVTNAVINCNSSASGLFISNGSNIGLANGILLTTGKATGASGPNNKANAGTEFAGCSTCPNFSDSDLQAIESQATYDGCVLEFDIKPVCNTLNVKYVFGSEEYPEYVNSKFNDAFGFFITGPNPLGGNYSSLNIAKLPNGSPVAINTVNNGTGNSGPCTNCAYYVNNTGGSSIQYDGFTKPLTASVSVSPCFTYHLKLAIADAGDPDFDSGVFLEYGGVTCLPAQIPSVTSNTTTSMCDLNNGSATAIVTNYNGTIGYQWSPGGQTSSTASGLTPGNYTCTMSFQSPCPYTKTVSVEVPHNPGFGVHNSVTNIKCPQDANGSATVTPQGAGPYTFSWSNGQTTPDASNLSLGYYVCTVTDVSGCLKRDTVRIFATTSLAVAPSSSAALCSNSTGIAYSGVTGGVQPYAYTWNTLPVQTTSNATDLLPGNYSVTVVDADGCIKSNTITVNNFFPTILFNDSILHATCNQANGAVFISSLSGGTGPYQFLWSGGQTSQNINNVGTGIYNVSVKDANNCPGSKTYAVNNYTYLPIQITQKDDKCEQKKGTANILVLGGSAPLTYSWSNGQTKPNATGLGQGTYTVNVTDAAGCKNFAIFSIINTNDVLTANATSNPPEPVVDENFELYLHASSGWSLDYAVTKDGHIFRDMINVLNYPDYGNYNMSYYMTSINGCKASYVYDFFIKDYMTLYFPNTFTPNEDGTNDFYLPVGTLVKEFKMHIYDRWGALIFSTSDLYKGWDGNFKNQPAEEATYTYKAWAKDLFGKSYTFVGHVNLIR
jgi:gliding motility-associated-like protein